jgi:hypothetical protein
MVNHSPHARQNRFKRLKRFARQNPYEYGYGDQTQKRMDLEPSSHDQDENQSEEEYEYWRHVIHSLFCSCIVEIKNHESSRD